MAIGSDAAAGQWEFWIDRGGTFTDIVAKSPDGALETRKFLSENPEAYDDAAIHGVRQFLDLADDAPIPGAAISAIKMGTTVATNALLERKGEPTVFVTSKGFRDVIEIGFQARPDTFALDIRKPELVYEKVIEVEERVRADGEVECSLELETARALLEAARDEGYRSVAIALMHAYRFPDHEKNLAALAREVGFTQVSASHEVSPLTKIVSRAETTVVDAYLTPILRSYVDTVAGAFSGGGQPGQLLFMQSSGGLIDAARFRGAMRSFRDRPAGSSVAWRPRALPGSTRSSVSTWAALRLTSPTTQANSRRSTKPRSQVCGCEYPCCTFIPLRLAVVQFFALATGAFVSVRSPPVPIPGRLVIGAAVRSR